MLEQWRDCAPLKDNFEFHGEAPANIAWVKYWGKRERQLPQNASLSMTLKNSVTKLVVQATSAQDSNFELWFDGARHGEFEDKAHRHWNSLVEMLPVLGKIHIKIEGHNTFPHSTGIASSASFHAVYAIAVVKLLKHMGANISNERQAASFLARLGSGSACRSLWGGFTTWGKSELVLQSSDEYATPLSGVHRDFLTAQNTVLVVSSTPKQISSRAGHGTMNAHPFAQARLKQAQDNLGRLFSALQDGNWTIAGQVLEEEALSLHALMLSARPGYILLAPNSLEIIRLVRLYRQETNIPLYFTIDAGPNIHLIYPKGEAQTVKKFINDELMAFTEMGTNVLWDEVGAGPSL